MYVEQTIDFAILVSYALGMQRALESEPDKPKNQSPEHP